MYKFNFDTKISKLENGLEVVTVKKDTRLTSINVGIKVGALYESVDEKGISHFIEHMLFKGTKKRNNEELNDLLESLGGEYNAFTDYMVTVYSITCLAEEMENATEILSDMVINSTFKEEEIEKERGVILAEIKSSNDDVEDVAFRRINEEAFSKSNLRYEVAGTTSSVSSFKREELIKFYNKHYCPENAVISFVSNLEHEDALELIKKHFNSWSLKYKNDVNIIIEKNKCKKFESYKSHIEQSSIMYLYTFHDLKKEEELAFKILNHKFGESSNSILFRELRENRGLAYDVYTHIDMTKNVKTLYIYTAVSEEDIDEALEVIDECIEKIKNEVIIFDDKTLNLMKKIHKTAVISTLEDPSELSSYVLNQLLDGGDIKEFIQDMRNIENLKSSDIYEVGRKILKDPTIHVLRAGMGDKENE